MIETGMLGLDTSHPEKFASVLNDRDDTTVGAVWDSGDRRNDTYIDEFCTEHDATRYDDARAMIDAVDAVMVLTVDWCTHRPLAVPFLEAGVPTMIDKPLAGSVSDVDAIAAAAKRGDAPLYGGSAVPFHPAVSALPETNPETLFCSGYGDPFYYGVHLIDAARSVLGVDWTRIEPIDSTGHVTAVHFEDGSTVTFDFDGSEQDATFAFLSVGDRTDAVAIESTVPELERMYDPYLDGFVAAARGERNDRHRLIDGARLHLGVQTAIEEGKPVPSDEDVIPAATPVDSTPFLADYEPYY